MLGGNDFDLNQQGSPGYYESATNLFRKKKWVSHWTWIFRESIHHSVVFTSRTHSSLDYHHTDRLLLMQPQPQILPSYPRRGDAHKISWQCQCSQGQPMKWDWLASQILTHWEQITPVLSHLIHWVRLTKVPIKEGEMRLLFQKCSNGSSHFSFNFCFLNQER